MATASPEEVSTKMKVLLGEYARKNEITFEDILDFHVKFERIHPFQDGNGRTGRLILFKECLKNDIIPFVINASRKAEYYHALNTAQTKQDYSLLERFFREEQAEYRQQVEGFLPPVKEQPTPLRLLRGYCHRISAVPTGTENIQKTSPPIQTFPVRFRFRRCR